MAIWNKNNQAYLQDNKTLFEAFLLADKDGNVINSFGVASNIPIAAGLVDGYSHINKFGYTGTDVNDNTTIWDGNSAGNLYPFPTTAGVATVASDSNSGATVEIQGLDENYNLQVVTATIGGSTTEQFIRIFRARMVDVANDDDVDISIGGTVVAKILEGNGQTLMAVYTVPAGKTAYFMQFQGTTDKVNAPMKFKLMARPFDNGTAFNIKGQFGTQGGNPVNFNYAVPLVFAEKTDLKIDIEAGGTVGAGATFDIILVDNPA